MTQAQKTAKAKFKQAIAYRTKTGVSLKEAFAHIYGKKKVVKKAVKKSAPKKKVVKKAVKKKIAGPKDSKLIKKELAKKGLKMPHGYATVKRKRKISGVKKKPTETQVLKSIQKAVSTQKKHMMGATKISFDKLQKAISNASLYKKIIDNINKELISKKGFPAYIIKDLKDTKKTYTDLLKEEKIHITQLKKFIK